MTELSVYEGWVRHRRDQPVKNCFRYGTYLTYLPLDALEAETLPRSIQSRFRREDHFGDAGTPLDTLIRAKAAEALGSMPLGPICLLTHLRRGGYVFNPVSFYYLWMPDGTGLEAVIAEVHNTPWKEEHLYVVPAAGKTACRTFEKRFHVSPFMGMDQEYRWTFTTPGSRLAVHMENYESGQKIFDATMVMKRLDPSTSTVRAMALRHPMTTYATISRIYMQALKLWAKGAKYHSHPNKLASTREVK